MTYEDLLKTIWGKYESASMRRHLFDVSGQKGYTEQEEKLYNELSDRLITELRLDFHKLLSEYRNTVDEAEYINQQDQVDRYIALRNKLRTDLDKLLDSDKLLDE